MSRLLSGAIEGQQPDPLQNLLQQALMPQQQQQVAIPSMNPAQNQGMDRRKAMWDVLGAIGMGLATGNPGTSAQMFQQMSQQREQNRQQSASANATAQWLKARGREDLIPLVEAGMAAEALKMATQRQDTPASVQEYEYAKQNGFGGSFQDWLTTSRQQQAGAETFGNNPVFGKDSQGNTILMQTGNRGSINVPKLPEGVSVLDPYGVAAARARGSAEGKAAGEANSAAQGDMDAAASALTVIDQIKTSPYLDQGTGMTSLFNSVPGTAGRDFQNLVDQAKSGAFLTAVQSLRGLGALSNAEGAAATQAITRLDTATSKEAFVRALQDYEDIVRRGYERARSRVNGPAAPAPGEMGAAANDPLGLR